MGHLHSHSMIRPRWGRRATTDPCSKPVAWSTMPPGQYGTTIPHAGLSRVRAPDDAPHRQVGSVSSSGAARGNPTSAGRSSTSTARSRPKGGRIDRECSRLFGIPEPPEDQQLLRRRQSARTVALRPVRPAGGGGASAIFRRPQLNVRESSHDLCSADSPAPLVRCHNLPPRLGRPLSRSRRITASPACAAARVERPAIPLGGPHGDQRIARPWRCTSRGPASTRHSARYYTTAAPRGRTGRDLSSGAL